MLAAVYSRSEGKIEQAYFCQENQLWETPGTFFKEELLSVQSLLSPQLYVNSNCWARHDLVKMEKTFNKQE